MQISLFRSHKDSTPRAASVTWGELSQLLAKPLGVEKFGPAWSPASYPESLTRAVKNVESVACLVLDLDKLTPGAFAQVAKDLDDYAYLAHPSYSHTAELFCYRVIMQLSRPVLASEWGRFWTQIMKDLCVPVDQSTSDASRIYFMPARPEGAGYELTENTGVVIDVDDTLAKVPEHFEKTKPDVASAHGPIPEGQRDATLFGLAGGLRRSGLDGPEIEAALSKVNELRCHPPLPSEDIQRLAYNATRYDAEDDQQSLAAHIAFWNSRKPDIMAPDEYGIDIVQWCGEDDPGDDEALWLVQGIVAAGVPQVLAGPPKSGKSFCMYSLALAIASGRPWLDKYEACKGKVLILSLEDRQEESARRLWRLARGLGMETEELRGMIRGDSSSPFLFTSPQNLDALRRTLDNYGPVLTIIDSLSRAHAGDENSVQEMSQVTHAWNQLCREYETSVMALHHFNKNGEGPLLNRMRGSSDIGAMVRHAMGMQRLDVDAPEGTTVSELEFDGNLPGLLDPFSIGITDGVKGGQKVITMEYRSGSRQEKHQQVERDFLAFLEASEPYPQTKTAIFKSTMGAHTTLKTAVLQGLVDEGRVALHENKYRKAE